MKRYARGRKAWGICQRSGKRVPLDSLIRDGHNPGLLVAPEWWEPQHPQEHPVDPVDPIALYRPSPEERFTYTNACGPEPEYARYIETATLQNDMASGDLRAVLNELSEWPIGECVWIELDAGGWFVADAANEGGTQILYLDEEITGAASAGNRVYVTPIGSGIPRLTLVWDQASLTGSYNEGDTTSAVTVTASNGTAPYTYSYELIGPGAEDIAIVAADDSVTLDLTGTPDGTYVLELRATVTDDEGDTAMASLPVNLIVAAAVVAGFSFDVTVGDGGGNDGWTQNVSDVFTVTVAQTSASGYGYELDNAGAIVSDPAIVGAGRVIMIVAYPIGVEMYITNGSSATVPLDQFETLTLETSGTPVVLDQAGLDLGASYAGPGESYWWWPTDGAVWDAGDEGLSRLVTFAGAVIGAATPDPVVTGDLEITQFYMNAGTVYMRISGVSYPGDVWQGYGGFRTLRVHTAWGYFDCDFDVPFYYDTALGELNFDGVYGTSSNPPSVPDIRGWEAAYDLGDTYTVELLTSEPEALPADNVAAGNSQTFTVADLGGGRYGYGGGTLTPAGTIYGAEVIDFSSDGTSIRLVLGGILPQDWFIAAGTQIPRNSNVPTLTAAAADSFSASGGQTTWTWNDVSGNLFNASDVGQSTYLEVDGV